MRQGVLNSYLRVCKAILRWWNVDVMFARDAADFKYSPLTIQSTFENFISRLVVALDLHPSITDFDEVVTPVFTFVRE